MMIYVIGLGIEGAAGLGKRAGDIIGRAGLIAAGARHLLEFKGLSTQKVAIKTPLEGLAAAIERFRRTNKGDVAILATGDPLLFGIADFIIKRFGRNSVEIIPGVSAVQSAFALIKENMNGLTILSVHSGGEDLKSFAQRAARFDKLALLTSPANTPSALASAFIGCNASYDRVYVAESLGMKGQRVIKGSLEKISRIKRFSALNLMILVRDEAQRAPQVRERAFGAPDALFAHENGMITKEELRAIILSKLDLKPDSVVWDIGAGSGSVAVEAAGLCPQGWVYAVEKNARRINDIVENKRRFGAANLTVIKGQAPGCLNDKAIDIPDAVFVGGGGIGIDAILKFLTRKTALSATIVVSAVTMETAAVAYEFFSKGRFERELAMINIAKTRPAGRLNMLAAANPIFIITAKSK